jgi:hypothetical protein
MNQASVAAPVVDPRANEPASSQMTWALKLATGVDHRQSKLTRAQASALLAEANAKSGYVSKGKPKGSRRLIEAAQG